MTAPVLVAGIGNIFLGDDGFGPEVVRRFAVAHPHCEGVRPVDYGIRGLHLAYDVLDGCAALVIVDAVPTGGAAGSLQVLEVGIDDLGQGEFDAHGMNPVAVLANLDRLGGTLPPTYVVGCQPDGIEEGIGLSPAVEAVVDDAVRLVHDICDTLMRHGTLTKATGA